jgi:hypothetical protein
VIGLPFSNILNDERVRCRGRRGYTTEDLARTTPVRHEQQPAPGRSVIRRTVSVRVRFPNHMAPDKNRGALRRAAAAELRSGILLVYFQNAGGSPKPCLASPGRSFVCAKTRVWCRGHLGMNPAPILRLAAATL